MYLHHMLFIIFSLWNVLLKHALCSEQDGEPDSGPLFMLEPPSAVLVQSHVGAVISCSAYGKPAPVMSWIKSDGSPLTSVPGLLKIHTNNSLQYLPFQGPLISSIHRTSIRCVATNSIGRVVSRRVTVKTVKPSDYSEYSVYTQDVWVMVDNTAVFTCDVKPAFVQPYVSVISWYIGNSLVNSYESRYNIHGSSLYITSVSKLDDGKRVRCVTLNHIQRHLKKESRAVTLNVINPVQTSPTIDYKKDSITTKSGQSVTLPCVAHSYPVPRYRWYKNGEMIVNSSNISIIDGNIHISHASTADSGLYLCNATNIHGSNAASTNLIVTEPLSVQINPRAQKIDAGLSAELMCTASGGPPTRIVWYKDGEQLLPSNNILFLSEKKIQIHSVSRRDIGMYQCLVSSYTDNSQASSQLQLGLSRPSFHDTDSTQYKHPGSSCSLRCQVYGNPIPTVNWLLADSPLHSSDRIQITSHMTLEGDIVSYVNITDLHVMDGGQYSCVANNSVGTTDIKVNLNVYGAPTVRHMVNRTATSNRTIIIKCHVSGYPIASFTWFKDNAHLRQDHRLALGADGTLSIGPVKNSDEGWYNCTVNNTLGQSSSAATYITVITPPILQPISFPPLTQGDPYTTICQIRDGQLPIHLSWYKNGQPITEIDNPNLTVERTTPYISSLTFKSVQTNDIGNYTCKASNRAGVDNSTSVLSTVYVEPYWLVRPTDSSVILGRSILLSCEGGGNPRPNITWKKAVDYKSARYRYISDSDIRNYEINVNGSLLVRRAQQQDDGYYLCHVDNGIGPGISQSVRLSVNVPATFDVRQISVSAHATDDVILMCSAVGDQPLSISWSYKSLNAQDWIQVTKENRPRWDLVSTRTDDGLNSTLQIKYSSRNASGEFVCTSKNQYGHSTRLIRLSIQELPSPVNKLTSSNVKSRKLSLSWKLVDDGNSPITKYIVQFSVAEKPWSSTPESVSSYLAKATIPGLTPATNYKFRVLAVNSVGQSDPSYEIVVMTEEEAPSGMPTEVKVKPVNCSSLQVTWQAPDAATLHGKLKGYTLRFRANDRDAEFYSIKLSDSQQLYNLTNLLNNVNYTIVISAFNSKGEGPLSNPVISSTLETVPSRPPTNLQTSVVNTTINIMWESLELPMLCGNTLGYKVFYFPVNDAQDESNAVIKSTPETSLILNDLDVFTNYSVQIFAYTSDGDGVRSYPHYVQTPPSPASRITLIKCTAVNESSLIVSWLPPNPSNGILQQYQIVVSSGSNRLRDITVSHPKLDNQYLITDLEQGQPYSVKVRAKNFETQYGEFSDEVVARPKLHATPSFPVVETNIKVRYHESLQINCSAYGGQILDYSWSFEDGVVLPVHFETFSNGSLYARNIVLKGSSRYRCRASNKYGDASIIYTVQVLDRPEPPVLSVVSVSSSAVQINWLSSGNGGFDIMGWLLEYKTDREWQQVDITAQRRSHWLQNFACDRKYDIRMRSRNHEGSSRYSNVLSVQTAGSKPVAPTKEQFVRGVNATSVALDMNSWYDGSCHVTHYSLEYKIQGTTDNHTLKSSISSAQSSFIISDLDPAQWYHVRVTAYNNAGSTAANFYISTLTIDGYTIAPKQIVKTDRTVPNSTLPLIIALSLVTVVMLLISAGFFVYWRRRRQTLRYKKRCKGRRSVCSDASDLDAHHAIRSHFSMPRENISGESRLWLLNSQLIKSPSENLDTLKSEDDYEDCTPTLSYTKARLAKLSKSKCSHNVLKSSCNYCCEVRAQSMLDADDSLKEFQLNEEKSKQYDILLGVCVDDFPPPPPEVLTDSTMDSAKKGTNQGFMNYPSDSLMSRPNTVGQQRMDMPAPISRYPSYLSSVATVSSNQEELLIAYHNSKANPLGPIKFETPKPLTSSLSAGSSDATEPGIRHFTQSPPKPEETRQAVCEVPIYHSTLPDKGCRGYNSSDTATDNEPRSMSLRYRSPHRKVYRRKNRRPRQLHPFRDVSDELSTNSDDNVPRSHRGSRSSSASDRGYGSHIKSSLPYTDSSQKTAYSHSKSHDCEDLCEEEERMSLVQTAAETGETTPPSTQRYLGNSIEEENHKLICSAQSEDMKVLDRRYRTVSSDCYKEVSTDDDYTDDYTIV